VLPRAPSDTTMTVQHQNPGLHAPVASHRVSCPCNTTQGFPPLHHTTQWFMPQQPRLKQVHHHTQPNHSSRKRNTTHPDIIATTKPAVHQPACCHSTDALDATTESLQAKHAVHLAHTRWATHAACQGSAAAANRQQQPTCAIAHWTPDACSTACHHHTSGRTCTATLEPAPVLGN
jgi:hypothetical protein